jgi:hypothetical protein
VGRILQNADRTGLGVWVGLYHDSAYWNRIAGNRESAAACLRELRSASLAIARDLAPVLKRHSSFAGWYLSEEVDDGSWLAPENRRELMAHLTLTSAGLRDLVPGSRVAVSGFSNGRLSPGGFRAFWKDIYAATSIGMVLLQDGIGVRKLELDEFPLYAGALAAAARETGRECGIVIELFEQISGAPLDGRAFAAVPAPIARVRRQLEIAARSTGPLVAFSVPEYMSTTGIDGAGRLYHDYTREILGEGRE